METAAENAMLKQFASMYAEHPNIFVILDRVMKCVWTNNEKRFPKGQQLTALVRDPFVYPLKKFTEVRIFHNDEFLCARLTPVKNEVNDPCMYLCEIVDGKAVMEIASKTDASSKLLPFYNSIEYNLASVWNTSSELHQKLLSKQDFETLEKLFAIQSSIANISSVAKNAFEYADMLFAERDKVRIDAGALLTKLVERCNAGLAKCGRRVEVICEPEALEIMADGRHAVAALINAVQNALLYSPRDCVPIAAVYRAKEGSRSFVVFSVTNDNIMFTDEDFSENLSVNFSYQRLGYGIPIIRRFAEESGGSLAINDNGGKKTVIIRLPAATEGFDSELRFNQPILSGYSTGVPDIIDIKIREVLEFFGEK